MKTTLKFALWYEHFQKTDLYLKMSTECEGSPYHREPSVSIHTDMVLKAYLKNFMFALNHDEVLGALAAVFHDVGKPGAMEVVWKEEKGSYKRFGGHETLSARLWEDYAVTNWDQLKLNFGLKPADIYKVGFMIEHHLPWGLKDKTKLEHLALTIKNTVGFKVFANFLMADQVGRISDDQEQKIAKVNEWICNFRSIVNRTGDLKSKLGDAKRALFSFDEPVLFMPIGASGSGKTTFEEKMARFGLDIEHFSLDDLRVKLYDCDYDEAVKRSFADKNFNGECQKAFAEVLKRGNRRIFVDRVNLSKRLRRMYIDMARRKGYSIVALLFPVALQTIIDRQQTRLDKTVKSIYVRGQYNGLQLPQFGEFDEILISPTNLPS